MIIQATGSSTGVCMGITRTQYVEATLADALALTLGVSPNLVRGGVLRHSSR